MCLAPHDPHRQAISYIYKIDIYAQVFLQYQGDWYRSSCNGN